MNLKDSFFLLFNKMLYNKFVKKLGKLFFISILLLSLLGFFYLRNQSNNEINNNQNNNTNTNEINNEIVEEVIKEDGIYTSKEDVALYIHTYNKLPSNYVTKKEASNMGWVASKGNLRKVCENCSIGGDSFGNREGHLPKKDKRKYYECDIDYEGGTRNAKRIVYSNDGLIYYTDDHYNTFELLYGEP